MPQLTNRWSTIGGCAIPLSLPPCQIQGRHIAVKPQVVELAAQQLCCHTAALQLYARLSKGLATVALGHGTQLGCTDTLLTLLGTRWSGCAASPVGVGALQRTVESTWQCVHMDPCQLCGYVSIAYIVDVRCILWH